MNRSNVAAAVVFALALPLVGCGAASAGSMAPPAPPPASAAAIDAVSVAGAPTSPANATDTASHAGSVGAVDPQKIVRDARLSVEVNDENKIEPILKNAQATAKSFGGYVAEETSSTIRFKVPTEKLDPVLDALAKGGGNITHRDVTARDVSAEYTDLEVRIENARRMQVRLREIAGQTQDVARLLDIERELSRVTTELEELEAQMRRMQNQTTYAEVALDVSTATRPGPIGYVFYGLYKGVKWLFVWG